MQLKSDEELRRVEPAQLRRLEPAELARLVTLRADGDAADRSLCAEATHLLAVRLRDPVYGRVANLISAIDAGEGGGRLAREDLAEVQTEALARAVLAAERCSDPHRFWGYLWTVVRNVVNDEIRRRGRAVQASADQDEMAARPDLRAPLGDGGVLTDALLTLEQAMADLSADDQRVIWMSAHGYSSREIGERVGKTQDAVDQARHRAKQRLRRAVSNVDDR